MPTAGAAAVWDHCLLGSGAGSGEVAVVGGGEVGEVWGFGD